MRRKLNFTEEDLQEMEAMYKRGWSTVRIARMYGCLMGSVWRRLKDRGVEMRPSSRRRRTAHVASHGYVKWGQSYVHRIVAAAWLGRPLRDGEVVHHKNGDKLDNRPENLEVFESNAEHMKAEHLGGWTENELTVLVRMRLGGATMKQIGQALCRSVGGVQRQIRNMKDVGRIPDRDKRREQHNRAPDRRAA